MLLNNVVSCLTFEPLVPRHRLLSLPYELSDTVCPSIPSLRMVVLHDGEKNAGRKRPQGIVLCNLNMAHPAAKRRVRIGRRIYQKVIHNIILTDILSMQ